MENKHILETCHNCENKGLQEIKGFYRNDYGVHPRDEGPRESLMWYLLKCPVCGYPTLLQKYTCEGYYDFELEEEHFDVEIKYPKTIQIFAGVPEDIMQTYNDTLRLKHIDISAAFMKARKTLELICKNKNAKGGTLYNMLQNLVKEKIFPKELINASSTIRNLGNMAVHSDASEYNSEINEVIDILNVIINYLYIMPHKLSITSEKSKILAEKISSKV